MANENREIVLKGYEPNDKQLNISLYYDTKLGYGTGDKSPIECKPMGLTSSKYNIDVCFPDRFVGSASFWSISEEQAELITGLVKAIKPKVVLETGSHKGRSTRAICDGLSDNWELTTVDVDDLWAKPPLTDEQSKRVIRIFGASPSVLHTVSIKNIDFAFLDGPHDHDGVLGELEFVANNASDYCLILVDNYNDNSWPGVTTAVDDFIKEHKASKIIISSHTGMALLQV